MGASKPDKDHLRCVRLLKKAVKVMGHELCHCFGMKHCVSFNCLMQGSNHAEEASKKMHELCPCCLRKMYYSTEVDVLDRYVALKKWIDNLIETNPSLMGESNGVNYYYPIFAQWSDWFGRRIEVIQGFETTE